MSYKKNLALQKKNIMCKQLLESDLVQKLFSIAQTSLLICSLLPCPENDKFVWPRLLNFL